MNEILNTLDLQKSFYTGSRVLLRTMKLLMAKLQFQDWNPLDSQQVSMRISLLCRNLDNAITFGRITDSEHTSSEDDELCVFDTGVKIEDTRLPEDCFVQLEDSGLVLQSKDKPPSERIDQMRILFDSAYPRKSGNFEKWFEAFQLFLCTIL
jgi:hypothetical protein